MGIRSSSSAYVQYGLESTFGGGATQVALFGKNQKATGLEWTNNQIALPQLYDPRYCDFLYNSNAGSVNMEFVLSNPWIFSWLFHDPTSALDTGTRYDHTWDTDPAVNSNIRTPPTGHLEIGVDHDTNVVRNAKGVICTSLNMKTSIDNPVDCSMQLKWGLEDNISTTLDSSVATDGNFKPYNFTHATVEFPVATTQATVQDLDLTINVNMELLRGLGTPDAVDSWRKLIEITGRVNMAFEDSSHLQKVRDRAEVADMKILISNGLAGDDLKSIQLNLGRVSVSKHGSALSAGELILQDFDFQALELDILAKNDSASQP